MTSFLALRVSVWVSVVSNPPGMLYLLFFYFWLYESPPGPVPTFNPNLSCWKPSREREVSSSKPGRPIYNPHDEKTKNAQTLSVRTRYRKRKRDIPSKNRAYLDAKDMKVKRSSFEPATRSRSDWPLNHLCH